MGYRFSELTDEVKRRAFKDQAGTTFDTAAKRLINFALLRLYRDAYWKPLRRTTTFDTIGKVTTGTVSVNKDANTWTFGTLNPLTSGVKVGQRISATQAGASTTTFIIATVTSTTVTTTENYDGDSNLSAGTYEIFGVEEYNLPIDLGRVALVWHEKFGFPFPLEYNPTRFFYRTGANLSFMNTPTHYRLWGTDFVKDQPVAASVMRITSSASADKNLDVMVTGTVGGLPDFEKVTTNGTNGTTAVSGSKSFTKVDAVSVEGSHDGVITVDANSANVTVAEIPVGEDSAFQLNKIQVWPIPDAALTVNVFYYKKPRRMINDEDVHELGGDFDEAIILGAVKRALSGERQNQEFDRFAMDYADEFLSLKRFNADNLDRIMKILLRGFRVRGDSVLAPGVGFRQLGGFFGPSVG